MQTVSRHTLSLHLKSKILKYILIALFGLSLQPILAQDITTFPYFTGFEGQEGTLNENFPTGWISEDLNTIQFGNQGWQIIKNTNISVNARTDTTAIHMFSHASQANDDWLYTPSIQMTAGKSYTLSFWYRAQTFGNTSEQLKIHIANTNSAAEMLTSDPLWDKSNISNTDYQEARITYSPGNSGIHYFGFHYYSPDFQFILLIDDVTIEEDGVSSIAPLLPKDHYRVLQNPVVDQINLQFSKATDTPAQAVLYNLEGRPVHSLRMAPGSTELSLATQQLPKGYYILRVLAMDGTWQLQEKIVVAGPY